MTLKHYDDFNAAAGTSLATKSYWTTALGTWTETGAGTVEYLGSFNVDGQAVHGTDANLGLPASFNVATSFALEAGVKYVGLLGLSDSGATGGNRIEVRWREDFGQRIEIRVPGFADHIVTTPSLFTYGNTPPDSHTLEARFAYQGMNNGKPEYIVEAWVDGVLKAVTPPRRLNYWTSSHYFVGLTARRESFGVPSPTLYFHHFASEVPGTGNHEPKPAIAAAASRTPISIATETPNASPATFPFELRQARVLHQRHTRRTLVDMGYEITHPRLSGARRIFECGWIGSESDADTLETFFDSRTGIEDNFQVTIRAMGIGTVDVAFLDPELTFEHVAKGVKRCSFALVELIS